MAFVLPGMALQVLPVGLDVYGGITAIAIIVVMFMTWERVQYSKVCEFCGCVTVVAYTHSTM